MNEDTSAGVLVWWGTLSAISVLNIVLWSASAWSLRRRAAGTPPAAWKRTRVQLALSAAFVAGCAFRSFLPRAEGQRISLVGGWISSAMIGRSVATVAELCLVAQWALALHGLARRTGARGVLWVSYLMVPLIAFAEICSWYTTLTTNFIGSVIEESTWALTSTLMTLSFAWVWPRLRGLRARLVGVAIAFNAAYVMFMCTVDVPMYWSRWKADEARGRRYLSVAQGIGDSQRRRIVTRRWIDWHQEMPWMSLYFSTGVWISIGLARTPLIAADPADRPDRESAAALSHRPLRPPG